MRRAAARARRADRVGLCGWVARRREHGEHLAFIDLRDRTGVVQCVVDGVGRRAQRVRRAGHRRRAGPARGHREPRPRHRRGRAGRVRGRGPQHGRAAAVPRRPSGSTTDETVRLRHRYVDLRRDRMQRNLRARATVNSAIRRSMEAQGFVEIETPMLIASTPEGARDFVVPSRLHPGSFYALPQSPQLFKQLHMVGGHRPLLPDRPLPARRGPPGRPPVRVHAARRRGQLRRPGRGAGLRVGRGPRLAPPTRSGAERRRHPADDVARGHGALRLRQARHPLRHGAGRADRGVRGHRVQGVHGPDA